VTGSAPGRPDDLDLTSVAVRLRSTLAEADDIRVTGSDDVLSTIRRRSARRRQTKIALGGSLGAFVLTMTALALFMGGGPVGDGDELARRLDPHNASSGAPTSEGEGSSDPSARSDSSRRTAADGNQVDAGRCNEPDLRDTEACRARTSTTGKPSDAGPGGVTPCAGPDCTSIPGLTTGPGATVPGGGVGPTTRRETGPAGPTTTRGVAPPTTLPPPPPDFEDCGTVEPGGTPARPGCLTNAFNENRGARFTTTFDGPDGHQVRKIFSVASGPTVFVQTEPLTDSAAPSAVQCTSLTTAGAPEWYAYDNCTPIAPS
jgi:hypothetical protein